jgi:hypothetical protein
MICALAAALVQSLIDTDLRPASGSGARVRIPAGFQTRSHNAYSPNAGWPCKEKYPCAKFQR